MGKTLPYFAPNELRGIKNMVSRILNADVFDDTVVSSYKEFTIQVTFDKNSPLVLVRMAKMIPSNAKYTEGVLNELNLESCIGCHLIQPLKENMNFYTFKFPCWFGKCSGDNEFTDALERGYSEAQRAYNALVI